MIARLLGAAALLIAIAMPGAALAQSWGSLYYSPSTDATGFSFDWPSQEDAELTAAEQCAEGDCEWAISFQDSCGAVAASENGAWSGGFGADPTLAQNDAVKRCSDRGGAQCEVVNWECSD